MAAVIQRSLSAGEVSPAIYGRADQVKYATGARTMVNFMVQRFGGATNRPGTKYIRESIGVTKLRRFVYSDAQTVMLEFGEYVLRFIKDGVPVTVTGEAWDTAARTITGITRATNAKVTTSAAHGFTDGQTVRISGVVGMTQINGLYSTITVVDATSFTMDAINSTSFTAWSSGGSAYRRYVIGDIVLYSGVNYYCKMDNNAATPNTNPFIWYAMPAGDVLQIPSPVAGADTARLQFTQSADVLTIVHPSHAPMQLKRFGATRWTLSSINFIPTNAAPTACQSTIGAAGTFTFKYRVTAVAPGSFEESYAGVGVTKAITATTAASPCNITAVAHGFVTGDEVNIEGVNGMAELNGQNYIITRIDADNFTLDGVDATGFTAYTSGGLAALTYARIDLAAIPSQSAPNVISWTPAVGALEYNVYKESNGVYGYIGTANGVSFSDINYIPSASDRLPTFSAPFGEAGEVDQFPQTTAYFQQRHAFAGTNDNPELIKMSRTGVYNDFSSSSPLQDDDSISFNINGDSVSEVRHLVNMSKPVVFTAGSVWTLDGDQDGVIRPTAINPNLIDNHGSNYIRPITVGNTALYISARGCIVRELAFDAVEGKKGRDLTVYANHLVDGHTIVSWAYQEVPNSVVWAVRDDGVMLGLTYVKEHEVWGWFRCVTDGQFLDVETIPEGEEDAVYAVVQRTIGGVIKSYVERFASRRITNMTTDAYFVDCGGIYDGRNVTATTLTIGGGTTWAYTEALTLTASTSIFVAGDVGKDYVLTIGAETLLVHVTGYTSSTIVSIEPEKNVPVAFRSVATAVWAKCASVITGLAHLNGKSVAVFADGSVLANGYDADLITVAAGSITLPSKVAYATIGLPYTSEIETLDWENPQQETLLDKQKQIQGISIFVQDTRGGWAGAPGATDDGSAAWLAKYLTEVKQRSTEDYGVPTMTTTGTFTINVAGTWSQRSRVMIRQRDPLPMTVLAIIPRGKIGG